MDLTEKTTRRQSIYQGSIIDVEVLDVQTPHGLAAKREVVHHAPAVAILAVNDQNQFVLERQWRTAVNGVTWEIPAGKLDDRDATQPLVAAKRELNEETRLQAGRWELINASYPSVGFSDEVISLYLATQLAPVAAELPQDRDEQIELTWVDLPTALTMVKTGEIQDMKTIMAIYYWASQN
ncbi:MAG: NUDIX hydrolase [Limosilactobacillus sp.]|nr:NUDIX hydrolase [Limosilactobacillus sp.]